MFFLNGFPILLKGHIGLSACSRIRKKKKKYAVAKQESNIKTAKETQVPRNKEERRMGPYFCFPYLIK